ncbi:cupin domain-containing protein [Candidatus Microgenomates bacterium]|nr:MAG: cupin domain-containing protein [Candidatus Microgenomates bacterium]
MKGYLENLIQKSKENTYFRNVLLNGKHSQIVIMNILPEEEIGEEVHTESDQILLIIQGEGDAIIEGEKMPFKIGDTFLVEAGTRHNFINTGDVDLKIITVYAPLHHPQGTIHKSKAEAEEASY